MDRLLLAYRDAGRREAKRLFPIAEGALCLDCQAPATDHHHLDGDTHNNVPENVVVLCRKCHLRQERQENHVGSRSKLTSEQIERIRSGAESISTLAHDLDLSISYVRRIRKGIKSPKPLDAYQVQTVPTEYQPQPRGKPRALTVEQVKTILAPRPTLGTKKAKELAQAYGVNLSTIFKARGRQDCYSSPAYD